MRASVDVSSGGLLSIAALVSSILLSTAVLVHEPRLKLNLYRASKAIFNMLAPTLHADHPDLTVLSIHPGWAATAMGTLDSTIEAEISVDESVKGMVNVLKGHKETGENLYLDWQGRSLPW
ncbi:hypothetical protein SB748_26345 [Rhizobium sp. SIMBA_035]